MDKRIVLTPTAEKDLESIVDYLFTEWGQVVCDNFLNRFEEVCEIIALTPDMYPLTSKNRKVRKCVLNKQNVVYFRVHENNVEVITIFDTRQNPKNLKKIIG